MDGLSGPTLFAMRMARRTVATLSHYDQHGHGAAAHQFPLPDQDKHVVHCVEKASSSIGFNIELVLASSLRPLATSLAVPPLIVAAVSLVPDPRGALQKIENFSPASRSDL
jgi:hypothetical protein